MKSLLSHTDLNLQFQSVDFVLNTQQQIAKDFATVGIRFAPDFETREQNYDTIIGLVSEKIHEVIALGESTLLQLMYQIDIPQAIFLSMIGQADFQLAISEIILQREAYKVYLRSRF